VGGKKNPPTAIYKGHLPPDPDEVIGLIELEGDTPIDTLGMTKGDIKVERPQLRIMVRSPRNDYERGRIIAENAYKQLHGVTDQTVGGGARYLTIEALTPPFNLGADDNGRWLIGFSIFIWKELN
jgi:hypothetical protein